MHLLEMHLTITSFMLAQPCSTQLVPNQLTVQDCKVKTPQSETQSNHTRVLHLLTPKRKQMHMCLLLVDRMN
jgi:hypothetical protein